MVGCFVVVCPVGQFPPTPVVEYRCLVKLLLILLQSWKVQELNSTVCDGALVDVAEPAVARSRCSCQMRQWPRYLFRNFRNLSAVDGGVLGVGWAVTVIATQSLRRWCCYFRNEGPMIADAAGPRLNLSSPIGKALIGERGPKGHPGNLQGSNIKRQCMALQEHEMISENRIHFQ